MSATIGINGFGRMGRLALRAGWDCEELRFVQINEISGDAACAAHLLEFDSVHGIWDHVCRGQGSRLDVDGHSIAYSSNERIEDTAWSGCDIVIDANL